METGGRGSIAPQILTEIEAIKWSSIIAPFPRLSDLLTSLWNRNKIRFQKISSSYFIFSGLEKCSISCACYRRFWKTWRDTYSSIIGWICHRSQFRREIPLHIGDCFHLPRIITSKTPYAYIIHGTYIVCVVCNTLNWVAWFLVEHSYFHIN